MASAKQVNDELAREHKITWTEAARRNIAEATRISGPRLNDNDRLRFAYKLALAAEVDAGRMTPELADYRYVERSAADQAAEQQRRVAAVQSLGNAMQQNAQIVAAQNAQPSPFQLPNRTINCMSQQLGTFTNTTCN